MRWSVDPRAAQVACGLRPTAHEFGASRRGTDRRDSDAPSGDDGWHAFWECSWVARSRWEDDRMPLSIDCVLIDCVLIDCVDLDAMTTFWCQALDFEHVWTGPSGGHLLVATDGSGGRLGLMPSKSEKTDRNRVHFDLRPDDQQAEVSGWRTSGLGASSPVRLTI
jgi:hypothetical protein